MRNRKPDTLADLVTDLLAGGPLTGYEIVRALEARYRLPVRGREGAVYAGLLQLERDGFVVRERREDGRLLHALPVLADVAAPGEDG